jgi:hypothetical protein
MDAAAYLVAEHLVDQAVLRDTAQALERGCRYDRIEVMAVAAHIRASTGNAGLDPGLELFRSGGGGTCRHAPSVAGLPGYTG